MKKSKFLALGLIAVLCMGLLSGCSSIGTNSSIYTTQMGRALSTWAGGSEGSSSDTSSGEAADDGKTALEAPEEWSVTETGEYNFSAVEGADYYIIYLRDLKSDSSSFSYMSNNIEDDGSSSYSGSLSDLFDYCYGLYEAQVVAYPAIGESDMKKSDATTCEFSVIGSVTEPEFAYLWDCFSQTLGMELINIEAYKATSFPTEVEVTFTNQDNADDVITLGFENASIADDVFYASTQEATVGATYDVSAEVSWDDEIVTNPSCSVDLGVFETAADKNAMIDGYGYLNTDVYLSMDYPMVVTDFDPEKGGSAGTWFFFVNAFTTNKGVDIPSTFIDCLNFQGEAGAMGADYHDGENVEFTVTPADTTAGSAYSYTLDVQGPRGVISLFDGFFWNDMPAGSGTLELYEDGTFTMAIITPPSDGDEDSPFGPRAISESSINGIWVENEDGTLTLSYDHSSAVLTGEAEEEQM